MPFFNHSALTRTRDILFLAFGFSLPFIHSCPKVPFVSYLGLAWLLAWLLTRSYRQISFRQTWQFTVLLPVLYLLYLAGMLWTANTAAGWFDLQVKAGLLGIPVMLMAMRPGKKLLQRAELTFVAGVLLSTFITVALKLVAGHGTGRFYYISLGKPMGLHPTYYGMMTGLAVLFLAFRLYRARHEWPDWKKRLSLAALAWLVVFFFLLASRGCLVAGLVIGSIAWARFTFIGNLKKGLGMIAAAILLMAGLYFLFPYPFQRMANATRWVQPEQRKDYKNSATVRLAIWEAAVQATADNLPFGAGTGDAKDILGEKFRQEGKEVLFEKKLNAHNQFLQTTIAIGLPGLLVLLLALGWPAWLAWKKRQWLFFYWLMLIGINMLFESTLEVQAGVLFISYFYPFFSLRQQAGPA